VSAASAPVLQVRGLRVGYRTAAGPLWAVDGVDFDLHEGESLGLVGESGCGKSSLGRAILQLLPPGGAVHGSVRVRGRELVGLSSGALRDVRGRDVALVFQEPMTRLDPLMRVSEHFVETIRAHRSDVDADEARRMGRAALAQLGIPPTRANNYPHEFSGGMRQRIMLALGIVLEPAVVVADEPTTALDVIVQAQILEILGELRRSAGVGMLLVTHDLGVVAETCDRVAVMYAGKIVEVGPVAEVFGHPTHPYTQGLLASTIALDTTELSSIEGTPPGLLDPPVGCRFAARCPEVMERCTSEEPAHTSTGPEQRAACWLHPGTRPAHPAGDAGAQRLAGSTT
jgi:oligopeptide/dipeptide ABC transporter ATP-binding protein